MARPRRMQNAVIAVVIVVELIVLIGHPLFGWGPSHHRFAATPAPLTITPATAPSAASVLLDLSAAAQRQARAATTDTASGRYAYVERESWQLTDQQVGGGRVAHPLTRVISTWRTADGSGRAVTVAHTRHGEATTVTTLAADRLPALTGSSATLDQRLGLHRGVSTQTALSTFADVAAQEPIPASAEAEILRLLAGDAGLSDAGMTRDRNGRPGVAVTFTAPIQNVTVRDTLVLSAQTGALLEFDRTLAGPPGHLNVQTGALLSYTLYLQSGRVDRLGERPAAAG